MFTNYIHSVCVESVLLIVLLLIRVYAALLLLGRLLLPHSANLGRHLGRQKATSSAKWFQTNAVQTIVMTQSIEINVSNILGIARDTIYQPIPSPGMQRKIKKDKSQSISDLHATDEMKGKGNL